MAINNLYVFLVSSLLCVALCSCEQNSTLIGQKRALDGWCVANTGAPDDKLQAFIDYGCSKYDCAPIKSGGGCFEPNVILGHASWILDVFYRDGGICFKNIGFVTQTNPSYIGCSYP